MDPITELLDLNRPRPSGSSGLSGGPCQQIKQDLTECILRSDCVLQPPHRTVKDCLQSHLHQLPPECAHLRYAFFDCKRGLLDMRKRFRGLDPSQTSSTPSTST